MEAFITVHSEQGKYNFVFTVHRSDTPEQQHIEPQFYEQWTPLKKAHSGTHYEMEILTPINVYANSSKIHFHTSTKNQKVFVCWTGHVENEETAKNILAMWCVGTVYAIEEGEDFALLFEKHSIALDDFAGMIDMLSREHGIGLKSQTYTLK